MILPDPSYPPYPLTRGNQPKYFISDNFVFISTSNWSQDFFFTSMGTSFISSVPSMMSTVASIFNRDWNSIYAFPLSQVLN